MDEDDRNLRRIVSFENSVFRFRRNKIIFTSNLTLAGSDFHRIGAATEKAWVPAVAFTRGM